MKVVCFFLFFLNIYILHIRTDCEIGKVFNSFPLTEAIRRFSFFFTFLVKIGAYRMYFQTKSNYHKLIIIPEIVIR